MIKTRSIEVILAIGLLHLTQSAAYSVAPGISLDFNSLPSAQGWTYLDDGTGVPETSAFSVDGVTLTQNTMGWPHSYRSYYELANSVNPSQPYTFELTARVVGHETDRAWPFGFTFAVDNGSERIIFGLTTTEITKYIHSGYVVTTSIDTTQFHTYRLEGTPSVGWELFVDDISLDSGPFGPSSQNRLIFGDTTTAARAEAEITSLTFTQIPEPATFTLLSLGSLFLVMVSRKR